MNNGKKYYPNISNSSKEFTRTNLLIYGVLQMINGLLNILLAPFKKCSHIAVRYHWNILLGNNKKILETKP